MNLNYLYLLLTLGFTIFLTTEANPIPSDDVYCFRNHTPRGNFGPCDTEQVNPDDPDGGNQFNSSQGCCAQTGAAGFTHNRSGSRCSSCTSLTDEDSPGENEGDGVVNGGWSNWDHWSQCSVTCGVGEKVKRRTCTNPTPQNGGANCTGDSMKTKTCDMGSCAVNGSWGDWGEYGECSATCGDNATQTRRRECDNPAPRDGGNPCEGNAEEIRTCQNLTNCPIDGGWSAWYDWSPCSASCGDGIEERQRFCNNPTPQYNGLECEGLDSESRPCTVDVCPIHGGWSEWSEWQACSATGCNQVGWQLRSHVCNNPVPEHGGNYCQGPSYARRPCSNTDACPVNGEWGEWGAWGECSDTCGDPRRQRRRVCDNPAPRNGGEECVGHPTDVSVCEGLPPCPTTEMPTEVVTEVVDCDDEDADCRNSEEGSGDGAGATEDPCSHFQNENSYELCKKGLLDVTDVPGNEDYAITDTTTEQNPTTTVGDEQDPSSFSYSGY